MLNKELNINFEDSLDYAPPQKRDSNNASSFAQIRTVDKNSYPNQPITVIHEKDRIDDLTRRKRLIVVRAKARLRILKLVSI